MENVLKVLKANKCSGCGSCIYNCHKKAISLIIDEEGFLVPKINNNFCVLCGMCLKKCPMVNYVGNNSDNNKYYYAFSNDYKIHLQCSSGGIATLLSQYFIKNGGYVCGVAFSEGFYVEHKIIHKLEDSEAFIGSKYIQSNVSLCYEKIERLLNDGEKLLFIGLPCQVSGLKSFLGKDYSKLITIDLFCHGISSQKLFSCYLQSLQSENKIIDTYSFRGEAGYNECIRYSGTNKRKVISWQLSKYFYGFMNDIILRKSCYQCKFHSIHRIGDISLGDFWGIKKYYDIDDKAGVSAVILSTSKGKKIFENIREEVSWKEVSLSQILQFNDCLWKIKKIPEIRTNFFTLYKKAGFQVAADQYLRPKRKVKIKLYILNIFNAYKKLIYKIINKDG